MQIGKPILSVAFGGIAFSFVSGAASAQTGLQLSIGGEYSTGSYGGSSDTTIYQVPFTARVRMGDWSLRARIPFAAIQGPGGVVPGESDSSGGDRSGPDDGSDDPTTDPLGEVPGGVDEAGLADISLAATWTHNLGVRNYLDLTGRITLPTGDETKDLGTGETDFGLSAEVGHDFDRGGIYAFAGYKVRGGSTREDGAQIGAGGHVRLGGSVIAGVDAGWSESSLNGLDESADLTAYASFGLSKDWRVSLYALTGLTDNAPDVGAGLSLTWRADFRRPTDK